MTNRCKCTGAEHKMLVRKSHKTERSVWPNQKTEISAPQVREAAQNRRWTCLTNTRYKIVSNKLAAHIKKIKEQND